MASMIKAAPINDFKATVAPPAAPLGHLGSILVVEDEVTMLQLIRFVLARAGFSVLGAQNGEEAWSIFNANRDSIFLVLTDLALPGGIGGFELSSRLRLKTTTLPILFMSGGLPNDDTLAQELLEKGLFLHKPFSPSQLLNMVRGQLSAAESFAH